MSFKVGDRVKDREADDQGTIRWFEGNKIWVEWDNIDTHWSFEDELELISGNSEEAIANRASVHDDYLNSFEQSVRYHTNKIADLLIAKNKAYSNSALDPIRVFSKSDRQEQLRVRADDKLSRIRNGDTSEDAITDLCGYLILMKIAQESE